MKAMQLLLFVLLLWCQNTESLTLKWVNLGANVTLDCLIGVKDIYWVFQKLSDSPVVIMRTFTSESTSAQQEERFKGKYSTLTLSRLFINNITINELGIYYCVKMGTPLRLSNGTRLYITKSAEDETEVNPSHTQDEIQTEMNQSHYKTTQQALIVLYVILNIVMIFAVIGLFQIRLRSCKKTHQKCEDEELKQLHYTNGEVFSEVEFHLFHPSDKTFLPFQKPKMKPNRD